MWCGGPGPHVRVRVRQICQDIWWRMMVCQNSHDGQGVSDCGTAHCSLGLTQLILNYTSIISIIYSLLIGMHFVSICKIINYNLYNIINDIVSSWPSQPKWCWVVLVGYSLDLPNSPGMVMRDDVSFSTNPSPVPQIRLIAGLSLVSRCSGASTPVVFPPRVIPESRECSAARLLSSVPHNEDIILPREDYYLII